MNRKSKAFLAFTLIPSLLLGACSNEGEPTEVLTSGAKSGIAVLKMIAENTLSGARPSSTLGVFGGLYLAQGILLPAQSALQGMEAIQKFLAGQKSSTTDENYALLKEVGSVLQVDIIDALNRSTDRVETVDEYTQSLKNAGILMERKVAELDELHDEQKKKVREERSKVRDIERELRSALKDQQYAEAGELEEKAAKANAIFAEIETKEGQTSDMIKRFQTLLDVAGERLQAVQNNREILIAGLKVIKVPGIVDLNILEENRSWRRTGKSGIFGE